MNGVVLVDLEIDRLDLSFEKAIRSPVSGLAKEYIESERQDLEGVHRV